MSKSSCPNCGADFIDILLGQMQVTHDCLIVDVIANCTRCNAELNIEYELNRIYVELTPGIADLTE